MFRKNARIRRHARRHPALTAVAGFIALALAVSIATHPVVLILLAVAGAGGYVLVRNRRTSTRTAAPRGQAPAGRPAVISANAAPGALAAAGGPKGSKLDARARRNGWVPPINPKLITMAVSPQCAELDCVACPGGACACPACRHQPARVTTINAALYDAAQAEPPVPF